MKKTKILAALFSAALLAAAAMPVSAAETSDKPFKIKIQSTSSTPVESDDNPVRIKTDSTSSYINYNSASGPMKFEAIIYGCNWQGQGEKDYTTHYYIYVDGGTKRIDRPRAIVTRGTRGFVRQDVYESGASHAKLKGRYYSGTGTASGLWSPDSVYEDLKDYNG